MRIRTVFICFDVLLHEPLELSQGEHVGVLVCDA